MKPILDNSIKTMKFFTYTLIGCIFFLFSCAADIEQTEIPPEPLFIGNSEFLEGDANNEISSAINLNYIPTGGITIHYETKSGTAVAGDDYIHTKSYFIIPEGEQKGSFPITIVGDLVEEPNESFTVQLKVDLILNGGFDNTGSNWTHKDGTADNYWFEISSETIYGGGNLENIVLEVDSLSQGYQNISVATDQEYTVSFKASRRITSMTHPTVSATIRVLDANDLTREIASKYFERSNTNFELTEETFTFVTAGINKIRLQFDTTNTISYGVIIDDLSITSSYVKDANLMILNDDE